MVPPLETNPTYPKLTAAMIRATTWLLLLTLSTGVCACTPPPTPTPLPPTYTITPSPTSTFTATPTNTNTPMPTLTPTATPLPLTLSVEIDPLQPIQGGLLLIRASANQRAAFSVYFHGQSVPVASQGDDRCLALVGIDACEPAGDHIIQIEASTPSGQLATVRTLVAVQEGKFTTEWITLSPDKLALLAPEIAQPEAQYLVDICSTFSTPKYWLGPFEVPWSGRTNSPFGARRSYNGETPKSCHSGMDIDGEGGEPVRAANNAVVALAEELKVRGNAIVLDHGWGIFSGYWHLNEILVSPGQRVDKGEVIGYLGNTGLSTGAHLHWEIRVHNVFVDPIIFTHQELPRPSMLQ